MGLGFGEWLAHTGKNEPQESWERAAFIAPERLAGDTAAGPASDVYALGGIAYWLLAARAPFVGSDPASLAIAHASEAPLPVSRQRAEARLSHPGDAVPPALDRVILMCLQKNPRERPRHAAALLQLLEPIAAVYPWTPPHPEPRAFDKAI
jgi:serine/threonine-protein kinase